MEKLNVIPNSIGNLNKYNRSLVKLGMTIVIKMKEYYVYIMSSNNKNTIYIGVTNNLERRVYEHKNKLVKGFTEKYNCVNLVYYETHNQIVEAIYREKQLKKWNRAWKNDLIEQDNPNWLDLSEEWKN